MRKIWNKCLMMLLVVVLLAGMHPAFGASPSSEPSEMNMEENEQMQTKDIYLAGGCFWGMEKLMEAIPGVVDAVSGYANGIGEAEANYQTVSGGNTGFRETVKVTYDPGKVSLDAILFTYFANIDPTVKDQQAHDIGTQYQTGIYYTDDASKEVVERIAAVERGRAEAFHVEIQPLINFFPAEEYHQDYLTKNPGGYCHIGPDAFKRAATMVIDPGQYVKPAADLIQQQLSAEQFAVTQEAGTELPFQNEYWQTTEAGIYVDVVTGEPLFSSTDKYTSSCGWPAFTKPIDPAVIATMRDTSHGMDRIEVRSRAGDSHLGHVFENDPESPNGVRFCINSASLRFIPKADMEKEGYGYLLPYVENPPAAK